MKILIITSHYLHAKKQANIHYIYNILKNNNYDVTWCTYPVSLSILLRRNRDKLSSFFSGLLKQRYIINLIPVYFFSNSILRKLFSFFIYNPQLIKTEYDVLLSEGIASSYIFERIRYEKLVVRLSDELGYLSLLSDEQETMDRMLYRADQVWCVLNSSLSRYANSIYLPNPSIHSKVSRNLKRRKELVYVGSNKIDNELVLKLAKSGMVVNIFSEYCSIRHKNIIFHGLVPKDKLISNIKHYKVGIIPFHTDIKNKFMEIPLKTFDYIAAGLHVAMISSSSEINLDFINCAHNHDDFIKLVEKLLNSEVDFVKSKRLLNERSMNWFEAQILSQISIK